MPPKKKDGYAMAAELPKGTVLNENKRSWVIKDIIGKGGFGLIYSGSLMENGKAGKEDYIIKIEPISNGPLFCEVNFYTRCAKESLLNEFKSRHNLKHLAVPRHVAFGLTQQNRFLVMDRFDQDLHKIMRQHALPLVTIIKIGLQMLHALEFLHSQEFVHADIKALNILRGRGTDTNVYLVDYGLAFRYSCEGAHKVEKLDPKYKHNGTIEYCSTDAHNALAPSRRGDIEILGYNLVDWVTQSLHFHQSGGQISEAAFALPWFQVLAPHAHQRNTGLLPESVKEAVAVVKRAAMQDPQKKLVHPALVKAGCDAKDIDKWKDLVSYFQHCKSLGYTTLPDYRLLQTCLCNLIRTLGAKEVKPYTDVVLDWTPLTKAGATAGTATKSRKRTSANNETEEDEFEPSPPKLARMPLKKKQKSNSVLVRGDESPANNIIPGVGIKQKTPRQMKGASSSFNLNKPANDIIPGLMAWKGVARKESPAPHVPPPTPPLTTSSNNRKSAVCQTSPELLVAARKNVPSSRGRKPKL